MKEFLLLLLSILLPFVVSDLSLPFPSLVREIQPTLSIYSVSGDPPCFIVPTSYATTAVSLSASDLVRVAEGHGAWQGKRVIFITHGYRDNIDSAWLHSMKNALVGAESQTVVILGWGGGSDLPHLKYKKAAGNIRSVGAWLGTIVKELKKMHPRLEVWGIGHSLGAHLMGVAGREALNSSGNAGGFDRIVGLDPSGPFFEGKNEDLRLQRGDGKIVDIIHSDGCSIKTTTNCWVTVNNHYATMISLGTIDFYVNYGELNPTTNPLDIDRSHLRAVNLFIASILHKGLFKTNETLEGAPGPNSPSGSLTRIRTNAVVAEMGYWLQSGFIPTPIDSRVNFFISGETLKVVERMGDLSKGVLSPGGRTRRNLVNKIDCVGIPSGGVEPLTNFALLLLSLALIGIISIR